MNFFLANNKNVNVDKYVVVFQLLTYFSYAVHCAQELALFNGNMTGSVILFHQIDILELRIGLSTKIYKNIFCS